MQLCSEYHIAHSEFLSWDPEDRTKAIAFQLEKADRCQMCGTARWEWDPEQGGNKFAYEAVEEICQGCLRKAAVQESSISNSGTNVILIPTNTPEYHKKVAKLEKQWRDDKLRLKNRETTKS